MTRAADYPLELLDVLACDISARPPAPGPADLQPYLVGLERGEGVLSLTFAPAARAMVESFAAAECVCCATLDWRVTESATGPVLELRATPAQLDAFATAWTTNG